MRRRFRGFEFPPSAINTSQPIWQDHVPCFPRVAASYKQADSTSPSRLEATQAAPKKSPDCYRKCRFLTTAEPAASDENSGSTRSPRSTGRPMPQVRSTKALVRFEGGKRNCYSWGDGSKKVVVKLSRRQRPVADIDLPIGENRLRRSERNCRHQAHLGRRPGKSFRGALVGPERVRRTQLPATSTSEPGGCPDS